MATRHTPWQALMQREVSRKEFLGLMGLGALILLNLEPILQLFGKVHTDATNSQSGYGSSVYGGERRVLER